MAPCNPPDPDRWDVCGAANPTPGWTVVDLDGRPGVHIVHDLREPFPAQYDGTVHEVKFWHGPEHFDRYEIVEVLDNLSVVMAPGARLDIRCPDLYKWMARLEAGGLTDNVLRAIYGEPWLAGQAHRNGFTYPRLLDCLERSDFIGVHRRPKRPDQMLYPNDWSRPEAGSDQNKQLDLWVQCWKR